MEKHNEDCVPRPLNQVNVARSDWFEGTVVKTVGTHRQSCKRFGFITTSDPFQNFVDKEERPRDIRVYFKLEDADWTVKVGDDVEFKMQLNSGRSPSAYEIRCLGISPVCQLEQLASQNSQTNRSVPDETERQNEAQKFKNKYGSNPLSSESASGDQESHILGNNRQRYGKIYSFPDCFSVYGKIRLKGISLHQLVDDVPQLICFKLSSVQSGDFPLMVNDNVSYNEDRSDPVTPFAVSIRPIKLDRINTEVFENYFKYLQSEFDLGKIGLAISCIPIWHSLGNCMSLSFNAIAMLNEFIIRLGEHETLNEKVVVVLDELLSTPLFRNIDGLFANYIKMIREEERRDEILKVYQVFIIVARLVPHGVRAVINLLESIVSNDEHSLENFLYKLLQQCTNADNNKRNDTPLVPSVQEFCTKILICGHMFSKKLCGLCNSNACQTCTKPRGEEAEQLRCVESRNQQSLFNEIDLKISRIKEKNLERFIQRADLSEIGDTASEYLNIKKSVEGFVQPGCHHYLAVKKIEKLTNFKLKLNWLEIQKKLHDPSKHELKIFGISNEVLPGSFISTGFVLGKRASHGSRNSMFGVGVYFFSHLSEIALRSIRFNRFLIFDVLLGKGLTVETETPNMTGQELHRMGIDSLFSKRGSKETEDKLCDTFVVYNPDQALLRYVVHYKIIANNKNRCEADLEEAAIASEDDWKKYSMVDSELGQLSESHHYHFHIAKSRFESLMSKNNFRYKMISVDYYVNLFNLERFNSAADAIKQSYSDTAKWKLKFCCPEAQNFEKIMTAKNTDNMKLLQVNGPYGTGVYFSNYPTSIRGFNNKPGLNKLMLCKVLPGHVQVCQSDREPRLEGYDSLRSKQSAEQSELVIFETDQVLPLYVIHFE